MNRQNQSSISGIEHGELATVIFAGMRVLVPLAHQEFEVLRHSSETR